MLKKILKMKVRIAKKSVRYLLLFVSLCVGVGVLLVRTKTTKNSKYVELYKNSKVITDEIKDDIHDGLYTLEDLVYVASCIESEEDTYDGQVAVAWCIRNRLDSEMFPSCETYKDVVSAEHQFLGSWEGYLDGSFGTQARDVAAGVLRGDIENPIGKCCFFFSKGSVWGCKPDTYNVVVGKNVFYTTQGDVTSVVRRKGYVPFKKKSQPKSFNT